MIRKTITVLIMAAAAAASMCCCAPAGDAVSAEASYVSASSAAPGSAASPGSSVLSVGGLNITDTTTIADIKATDFSALKGSAVAMFDSLVDPDVAPNNYNNSAFRHDGALLYYDDPQYDCLLGIDVSVFQGDIDWEAVKSQGISFTFIRAGFRGYGDSGTLKEDDNFRKNMEGAKAAGLLTGVYFFSQAVNEAEAEEEAEYVMQLLDGITLDLPLVYDAEIIRTDDARTDSVALPQFTKNALAFCRKVETAGFDAMIYVNLIWEGLIYDLKALSDYPVWFAGYDKIPLTPYDFEFWQYTESGELDGIDHPVDINIWMRKASS